MVKLVQASPAPQINKSVEHHQSVDAESVYILTQAQSPAAVPFVVRQEQEPPVVNEPVKPEPVIVRVDVQTPESAQGCESFRALVTKYFGAATPVAMEVMKAESGCNTNAVGDQHIPPVSCGLYQIRTLAGRPSCETLQNAEINVAFAHKLYIASGWFPWSVCNTGKVHCH